MRSQIVGGISNEISVILDKSTLLRDLKGISFHSLRVCIFDEKFKFQQSYLKILEEDTDAATVVGDSAYNTSKIKEQLGIQTPVPLKSDGTQPTV